MKRVLTLTRELADALVNRARSQPGLEVCGLIGGDLSHFPITNRAPRPQRTFDMDIRQQISALRELRERGRRLLAVYHSHPSGEASPSARDLDLAGYPDAFMLIIAPRAGEAVMRAWSLDGARIRETAIRIQEAR